MIAHIQAIKTNGNIVETSVLTDFRVWVKRDTAFDMGHYGKRDAAECCFTVESKTTVLAKFSVTEFSAIIITGYSE